MNFSDHGSGHHPELSIFKGSSGTTRRVWLQTPNPVQACQAEVELSELLGLVEWYRHMDGNDYRDYQFKSIPLKFVYSHFEKGELYYRVILETATGVYSFRTWEQGRETAGIMADRLNREIEAAG